MRKQILIAACLVAAILPAAHADDFKVVKCDADAAAEITEAYRFVARSWPARMSPKVWYGRPTASSCLRATSSSPPFRPPPASC